MNNKCGRWFAVAKVAAVVHCIMHVEVLFVLSRGPADSINFGQYTAVVSDDLNLFAKGILDKL